MRTVIVTLTITYDERLNDPIDLNMPSDWAAMLDLQGPHDTVTVEQLTTERLADAIRREGEEAARYEQAQRLGAAAPDMLAALKEIAAGCKYRLRKGEDSGDRIMLNLCMAAIRKATNTP